MGLNAASRHYGIPKPTIRRHRLGLNKYAAGSVKHRGAPCVLPKEVEDELVQYIKQLDELFFWNHHLISTTNSLKIMVSSQTKFTIWMRQDILLSRHPPKYSQ